MTSAPPLAPLPTGTAAFTGCSISACPDAASRARSFTRQALACWDLAELTDDAQVIVSELLVNAIQHAWRGRPGRHSRAEATAPGLWLFRQPDGLMCVVTDPSNLAPVLKQPGHTSESGRGLHVVHALSDHWGWTLLRESGKAVWAILFHG
jgi:anti-sigma regulatory factor (Ser/Thr protein kinase)